MSNESGEKPATTTPTVPARTPAAPKTSSQISRSDNQSTSSLSYFTDSTSDHTSPNVASQLPPSNPTLPGYDELVTKKAQSLNSSGSVLALRYMFLEDVVQRRAKVLEHYLHITEDTKQHPERALDRDVVSADLHQYSEAMKRWNAFQAEAHQTYVRGDIGINQLAARAFVAGIYEEQCAEKIKDKDPEAIKQALEVERRTIASDLQNLPWQLGTGGKTLAEIKNQKEQETEAKKQETELRKRREQTKVIFRAFMVKFGMAMFGGVSLIAPMLIMSLHATKTTSLVTTSVFTFFVAILLAWFMNTSDGVIAATAGYVAVLVVFVGTTTQPLPEHHHKTGGQHLSGGAIAGIVVGCLAGVFILLFLLAFCCLKGLVDGLMAFFGLGGRRRRRVEEPEYYPDSFDERMSRRQTQWFS